MATPVVKSSGIKTATGSGTEDTLLDTADAGIYALHVDTVNLIDGEDLTVRIYSAVLSGDAGADQLILERTISNDQDPEVHYVADTYLCPHGAKFTIAQTGTGVNFKWSVNEPS